MRFIPFKSRKHLCSASRTDCRGGLLISLIVILLGASALLAAIVALSTSSSDQHLLSNQSNRAFYWADSGLRYADRLLTDPTNVVLDFSDQHVRLIIDITNAWITATAVMNPGATFEAIRTLEGPYTPPSPPDSPTNDLALFMRFEDNPDDSSVFINDGEEQGPTIGYAADRFGVANTAGDFGGLPASGIGDRVVVPADGSLNLTNQGTLSAWIYLTSPPSGNYRYAGIIHKGGYAVGSGDRWYDDAYGLQFYNGDLTLTVKWNDTSSGSLANYTYISLSYAFDLNTWYHVTGTWDGSGQKLYVDGVELAQNSDVAVARVTDSPVVIGAQLTNSYSGSLENFPFPGRIDDAMIFQRALGSNEVWLMSKSCVAYHSLAGDGVDSTWRSNNATLHNTTWSNDACGGTVLACNGANAYGDVNVPLGGRPPVLTRYPFSLSAWVRPRPVGGNDGVFIGLANTSVDNVQYGTFLRQNQGQSALRARDPTARNTYGDEIDDSYWYFVVGVFNSSDDRELYVNGSRVADDGVATVFYTNLNTWAFGRWNDSSPDSYFNGCLKEVALWEGPYDQIFPFSMDGSGTAADPWQVDHPFHLMHVGTGTDHEDGSNNDYALDDDYEQTSALEMCGLRFHPIGGDDGSRYDEFSGVYNGQGLLIEDLVITNSGDSTVGLFACLDNGAEVYNVWLENLFVIGRDYVGGLAGRVEVTSSGALYQNYSTGTVQGRAFVGGLIGMVDDELTINDCFSTASVEYFSPTGPRNGQNPSFGGLIGYITDDCWVETCYAYGEVEPNLPRSNYRRGGLVGLNDNNDTVSDNAFYDYETFGSTMTPQDRYGRGLTTAQTGSLLVYWFAGWDILNVWTIPWGAPPVLREP